MHKKNLLLLLSFFLVSLIASANAWIRVNQLGYLPKDIKVAVWMSDENESVNDYELIDYFTGKMKKNTDRLVLIKEPTGLFVITITPGR